MLTMLTFISLYVKQWSLDSDKQINFTIKQVRKRKTM